jgi:DhnA family fructose-bisphosphate aldolase class Ia
MKHVQEILSWYGSDNPGTLTNLARLLNHGKLAGTGKLLILPVDQGFEHGLFSGGATADDDALLDEIRAIAQGGGFGSIIGRNSFQRSQPEALQLLNAITQIYC